MNLQHRKASAIARGFTLCTVEGRRQDAMRFVAEMTNALRIGMSVPVDRDFLIDTARSVQDVVSNKVAGMRRTLDCDGLDPDGAAIDTSDLADLITELEREAALAAKRGL